MNWYICNENEDWVIGDDTCEIWQNNLSSPFERVPNMGWYICKGRNGRLVVVRGEPNIEDYVVGPFSDHEDAFLRLQELELKRLKKGDAVRTLVTLVLCISMAAGAGIAMAEGNGNDGSDSGDSSSSASSGAYAASLAGAAAQGGSAVAEGGTATAEGGVASATGGNAESGSSSATVSEAKQFRNAPWVSPPAIQSSNPCATGWSAGVSGPGIGIGGGRVKEDEQCNLRETARLAYSFGAAAAAIQLLCKSEAWIASGVACPTDVEPTIDDKLAAGLVQIREDLVTERDAVCDERVSRCEAEVRK